MEATMRNRVYRLRLALPAAGALLLTGLLPAFAAEPSAAGLWQKIEEGKSVVYILVVDRGATFEGIIARLSSILARTPMRFVRAVLTTEKMHPCLESLS